VVVVPLTLFLILILLYMNTRSLTKTLIVLLAVPFSAIGAFWFLYLLGYNMSIGVWVGLIALLGVDAETGFSCSSISTLPMSRQEGGSAAVSGRPAGSDPLRGGQATEAKVHDRGNNISRPRSDYVVHWSRFRCDEADRRSDDRRHLYLFSP